MHIDFEVRIHPSGLHTLSEKAAGKKLPVDCGGDLAGNRKAAAFYKAVAKKLAETHADGHTFTYRDAPVIE
ncbi:hypothetical protein PQR64_23270 [Paraburkholderia phytofirmans]|uniref:hypothetical protein n=1 Tax=Paraburkholderia phytofirmans TaxID=261302 RepID=UPI0038BAA235